MKAPSDLDLLRAAEAVTAAEHRHAEDAALLTAAVAERDTIATRVNDLDATRTSIIARRQQGDHRDGDGSVLELNTADREGLVGLLAEREAHVAAARNVVQHAKTQADMARAMFARMEAQRAEDALRERAEQLAQLLAETVDALRAERDRLGGGRLPWTPSRALMDRLTPLDLGRAW